jgi:triosephosphate isomerase
MYKTSREAVDTSRRLVELVGGIRETDVMIAPAFTALEPVSQVVRDTNVALGAQNLHWEKEGAFTGEISADMLVAAGCRYVIIGHSERRQYFGENDQHINQKIKAAAAADLIPVLCVGETESQREAGETFSVLDKQVQKGLDSVSASVLEKLVLAYEPVWAIGTGKTATSDQAQEVHAYLRKLIAGLCDRSVAGGLRILYGGSVKPQNIAELMSMPDIDGALVGGASLDAESFSRIVRFQN